MSEAFNFGWSVIKELPDTLNEHGIAIKKLMEEYGLSFEEAVELYRSGFTR